MSDDEFKPFPKISREVTVRVTQKIHGTNAQIVVSDDGTVRAGSRNRWITPEHDNYGFAAWVHDNSDALPQLLGRGTHYGEWAGPGINSGEGLSKRTLVLFDCWRYPSLDIEPHGLPLRTVPLLFEAVCRIDDLPFAPITACINDLRANGSKLVPGFMRPEGVVVQIGDRRYKYTYEQECVPWKGGGDGRHLVAPSMTFDASAYLHKPRMLKVITELSGSRPLTMRDLTTIVDAYMHDLRSEVAVPAMSLKWIRPGAFALAKSCLEEAV